MKTAANRWMTAMAALAAGAIGFSAAGAPAAPDRDAPLVLGAGVQTMTIVVHVVHERTGDALSGMPVFLTPLEGPSFVLRQVTNKNGRARFTVLDGDYRATVIWNNNSESVIVQAGPDSPNVVTILFNPDLD